MKKLRVSGLVGLAKRVRQELAGPVSPERLMRVRQEVEETIRGIEQIFQEEHIPVQTLPVPSHKAFQFLKGLDWDAVVTAEGASAHGLAPESVSFRGLQRHFEDLLNRLARAALEPQAGAGADGSAPRAGVPQTGPAGAPVERVYETVVSDSANIEKEIQRQNLQPEHLKKRAREIRGWLAYFAQRENFERYGAAVRRAEPAFREICPWPAAGAKRGSPLSIVVRFRPIHGMYRARGYRDAVLVDLPTPMICFDPETLRAVARIAFRKGGDRQAVHDAAAGEAYRRIDAGIELLGGVVAQMRGLHCDLAESFDRINAAYFGARLTRPRLVWSRTFAVRKYGHYDQARDTVMVNAVLDQEAVPEFTVDFIVYHELLHRELGITWKNNRIAAHTPELAAREQQFKQYDEAKAILRKLASER